MIETSASLEPSFLRENNLDVARSLVLVSSVSAAPEGAVSIDLLRNKHSAVFDPFGSRVIGDDFIKVIAWYDNEYGYSSRVLDLASKIGKLL